MGHHHNHHRHGQSTKNLKVAFFLNLSFTVIEFIGGLLTGSMAIMSDALHDLGDSISIGLSWYFQNLSEKKRDNTFSYGYKRFSLLGAIINAVVLLVGSVIIISKAAPAIMNPSQVDEKGMLYIAIFGVVVNGVAVLRLRKGSSINERVISLHLLEDVLGWVAVLIGSLLIMYFDWYFIDPLLSVLIALFIIYNVFVNIKKSFQIILQATPKEIDIEKVHKKLRTIPEVLEIHDCHIWSMDGEYHVFSAHLVLDKSYDLRLQAAIKKRAKHLLHELGIEHSTLEFELKDEHCDGC
ncbi:cation diffusion facilitator family transporter [Roseivirga spongicola]|uniref:cation diffusion facilitator family transporter n=1 Tax=Roseivirga spongicola TaxID=333140 RepID=UPI002AC9CFAA|nr:cation diffusion facilitator family transporter [Roseivirga spongicola]WPZ11366.1 cation diffusion facilitator family transporter [Roseivirga spongicola]